MGTAHNSDSAGNQLRELIRAGRSRRMPVGAVALAARTLAGQLGVQLPAADLLDAISGRLPLILAEEYACEDFRPYLELVAYTMLGEGHTPLDIAIALVGYNARASHPALSSLSVVQELPGLASFDALAALREDIGRIPPGDLIANLDEDIRQADWDDHR